MAANREYFYKLLLRYGYNCGSNIIAKLIECIFHRQLNKLQGSTKLIAMVQEK